MPTRRGRRGGTDQPDFTVAVRTVIEAIAPGEVATYGEVAEEAGYPGAARAVGGVLARSEGLPWWRVVAANGRLVPGHEREQARRLRAEGTPVLGHRAVSPPRRRLEAQRRGTKSARRAY
jgi:methylated-DNA-protein-cysteine methyltransferase-like protein